MLSPCHSWNTSGLWPRDHLAGHDASNAPNSRLTEHKRTSTNFSNEPNSQFIQATCLSACRYVSTPNLNREVGMAIKGISCAGVLFDTMEMSTIKPGMSHGRVSWSKWLSSYLHWT